MFQQLALQPRLIVAIMVAIICHPRFWSSLE